jgi:hypothetical protein
MTSTSVSRLAVTCGVLSLFVACDDKADKTPSVSAAAVSASAALEAAKQAAAERSQRKVVRRAKTDADLLLNPERRAKLESVVPEAKGFLDSKELEASLFKQELKRGATDVALKAFDKLAKDRFVLFSGYIMDPKESGFDLAIRYTPRDPADPVGLTATWFPVHFSNVKGYDNTQYQGGEPVTILARYAGNQTTSQARDVILLEEWLWPAKP